jgi:hypothetical protein
MNTRIRQMAVAVAFAATVAAAITGATLRGETREASTPTEVCATAAWPMIPASCLEGGNGREVRMVSADNIGLAGKIAAADTMNLRFSVAFQ